MRSQFLTRFLQLSNSRVTILCDYLIFYVASVSCIVSKWELVWVISVLSASVWSSKIVWPLVGHIADRSNCYLCLRCDPPVSIIVFDHQWVTSQCDKSEPQRYFKFDHRVFWSKQKLPEMVFWTTYIPMKNFLFYNLLHPGASKVDRTRKFDVIKDWNGSIRIWINCGRGH